MMSLSFQTAVQKNEAKLSSFVQFENRMASYDERQENVGFGTKSATLPLNRCRPPHITNFNISYN